MLSYPCWTGCSRQRSPRNQVRNTFSGVRVQATSGIDCKRRSRIYEDFLLPLELVLLILVGGGGVSSVTIIDSLVAHLDRLGKWPRVQRCDIVPDLEQSTDYWEDKYTNKCSQYSITTTTIEEHRKCTGRKRKESFKCLARECQGKLQRCLTWIFKDDQKCARQRGPGMHSR